MYRRIYAFFSISILSVVFAHGINFGLWALYAWTDRYKDLLPANYDPFATPQWFILDFSKQILIYCVPAFYFISAFLFTFGIDKASGNVKWAVIKARSLGLLIPYLVWVIIVMVYWAAQGKILTTYEYVLFLLGLNGGYPFIPVLIIYFGLSRIIIPLARRNWQQLLVGSGIIQLFFVILKYTVFRFSSNPIIFLLFSSQFETSVFNFLFFYVAGIVMSLHLSEIKDRLVQHRKIIISLCGLFLIANFYITGATNTVVGLSDDWTRFFLLIVSQFYSGFVILTFFAFEEVKIPFSKQLIKLSSNAYGIYLTHYIFMEVFSKIIYHFYPHLLNYQIIFVFVAIGIGLGSSLFIMDLVKNSPLRSSYQYLFG